MNHVTVAALAATLLAGCAAVISPTADPRLAELAAWHYEARGTFHHAPAQSTKEPAP